MKASAFYAVLGVGALIVTGFVWYGLTHTKVPEADTPGSKTVFIPVSEGSAIYTNGEFGFLLLYPENARVEEKSVSAYHLPAVWRDGALEETSGKSLVSIITYTTTSDHSYPRYYTTLVRIGVSNDAREVARCETADTSAGETQLPDVKLGDATFNVFSFQSAGMMQYAKGESYRRVEQGTCYAIERIAVGSSYRDDAPSSDDIADEELTLQYELLLPIVESFRFAVAK
jgi:hypothetical protein